MKKQLKKQLKKQGFTLVELLIVAAIILIMTAAAISVVVTRNKPASEVESAAEQLVSRLKSLQNSAINGKSTGEGGVALCNFSFFTGELSLENNYNNRMYASVETPCHGGVPIVEASFLTAKGQNSSVTASNATATFSVPLGAVAASTSIILTSGLEQYFVCIAVGGQITGAAGQANIYANKTGCP